MSLGVTPDGISKFGDEARDTPAADGAVMFVEFDRELRCGNPRYVLVAHVSLKCVAMYIFQRGRLSLPTAANSNSRVFRLRHFLRRRNIKRIQNVLGREHIRLGQCPDDRAHRGCAEDL